MSTRAATPAPAADEFAATVRDALQAHRFVKLVLAKRRVPPSDAPGEVAAVNDDEHDLKRVSVRAITLRDEPVLSLVYTHATRDITRNLPVDDGLARIADLLGRTFSHAHLTTTDETIEWRISKKGQQTSRRTPAVAEGPMPRGPSGRDEGPSFFGLSFDDSVAAAVNHDQPKLRFVDVGAPYLTALGVTDAQRRVVPSMARKWKQINKFVEIVDHALATAGLVTPQRDARDGAPIRIADFGCGKGYLTFAVHEHLARTRGVPTETVGVELRPDLVDSGNRIANAEHLDGLRFEAGDLRTHQPAALDVMIALHACDTATDEAIHLGLEAGARVIMCSPCCHKQLRPQMARKETARPAALDGVLRHGVHLGQQAEMVTDSLRALLLEAEGYDAQVFEFIALEHTSKNKMILAVRRADAGSPKALAARRAARDEIARVKSFYAIGEQRLETLRQGRVAA